MRELASPSNPPLYPNININDDILSQSLYFINIISYSLANSSQVVIMHLKLYRDPYILNCIYYRVYLF